MSFPLGTNKYHDDESDYSGEEEEDEYDEYGRYRGFGGGFFGGGGYDDDYEDRPHSAGSSVPTEYEDECDVYDEIEPDSPAGRIGDLLKNAVENVGEFTFGGSADDLPGHPGLQVEGFGLVTLPLVDPAHAERLTQCGRMAPFGLGSDTVLDPQVRRTWQFDKAQVKITNPAWNRGIAKLMSTVATRLGCPNMPLECHFYKLLLYGPGCHFLRHRDTEKEDRMFATLVIQLPSAHQGGELVVYQPDGTALTHDFGAADGTSAFAHHYALHYADAEHELKPVTSGYRVALVYSICWPEGHMQVDLLQSLPAQRQLATHLTSLVQAKRSFFFMLEHQYTPVSMGRLRLQALKGKDRARALLVQAANGLLPEATGFTLYLVQGTRDVTTGFDNMGHSEEFNPWIDVATGKQYESTNKNSDLGQLINPDGKTKNQLWAAEKKRLSTRYTGNEGYEMHNRYNCYILVGVPKTFGPYAIIPYIGTTSIAQLIDIRSSSAADLCAFLSCLPDPLKKPPTIYEQHLADGELDLFKSSSYVPSTSTDFTAKLLEIIVDRALVECVPAFFINLPNPLSPAMIPVYVEAMKAADANQPSAAQVWTNIRPLLVSALPGTEHPFIFGLKLICHAMFAEVPQEVWIDLLEPIRKLAAPPNAFRSMRNTLTEAAKNAQVWHAIHGTVIKSLRVSLAENKPLNVYPKVTPHLLMFKLTLSLAVGASAADVEEAKLVELIDLFSKCDPNTPATEPKQPTQSATTYDYYLSYRTKETVDIAALINDSMRHLKAATRTPRLWRVVMPLVCRWLRDATAVPHNRFAFAVALVAALFNHSSPPPAVDDQLWQPIMDAAMSQPGFLTTTLTEKDSGLFAGYQHTSPNPREAAAHVVKAMRHQVVWNYVSVRVAQALGNGQERFDIGLTILKSAQKDNSIPTDRWSPWVPFVFSTVPTPSSIPSFSYPDGFSLVQDQLSLWSVVTVDPQRYPQLVDRTVTAFLQANAPHQLKQAVSAIIELVSHDPNLPSQTFLPLLLSRANWLQHQVPLPPRPQAPAASSSSSWVIPNASYPSDARIDQFLKTNEHTLHITGFSGIADARKWARNHPPPSNALRSRLVVEAGGIGKRAYVEVRKVQGTRVAQSSHVHQASADDPQMREYRQELERIQQVVQCIEAGQPVPNLAQGA